MILGGIPILTTLVSAFQVVVQVGEATEIEETAKLENFMEWTTTLGVSDSPFISLAKHKLHNADHRQTRSCLGQSLTIPYFSNAGGRGLCAVRDLPKGQLILKVLKSALMTSQTVMLNDYKLSVSVSKFSLSSTQILTIALLNEVAKGKRSWWYPYLTQFPSSYDILASFDQCEIQALQLDDAIWVAEKALEKAKSEWKSATVVMEEDIFTHNVYSMGCCWLFLPGGGLF